MGFLSSFLNPQKGYEKGQEELNKYYGHSQAALQPYNLYGTQLMPSLTTLIQNLTNPEQLQAKWTQGYNESPSATQAKNIAQENGLNAANSMGLLGSNAALHGIQEGTSQIGLRDRENYLNNLMQKYIEGGKLVSGAYNTGAGAGSNLSQNAMNMGQNSAQMAYNQENAQGSLFERLLGLGGSVAGSALGGPIGGALAKRWNLTGGL